VFKRGLVADVCLWVQIVDKTIMEADLDRDGKISFEEFTKMVENTDVSMSMTLGKSPFTSLELSRRNVTIPTTALLRLESLIDDADFYLQSKSERQIPQERPFVFQKRIT